VDKDEEKWRAQLGERFRMDQLEDILEEKRLQLIDLQRNYKLHNIKKDVYEQLKNEYTGAFSSAEKELTELRMIVIRWVSREKSEKNKIETKIRLAQGRMKSGEITRDEFDKDKAEMEKDIEKIDQRIKILDLYSKEKQKRPF
jgi:hypothetical protein